MKRTLLVLVVTLMALSVPTFATTAHASTTLRSCTILAVGTTTVEGADGSGYMTILFANDGPKCELTGYPSVQFFEPHATHLIGHDRHRASMVFANPSPHQVILARGGVASVGVTWTNDPQPHETCSSAQWINVVLPAPNREDYQPSANATPCGSAIWVTPFETGARPQFIWNAPPS